MPLDDSPYNGRCVRPMGCFRPTCLQEKACRMHPAHPRFTTEPRSIREMIEFIIGKCDCGTDNNWKPLHTSTCDDLTDLVNAAMKGEL